MNGTEILVGQAVFKLWIKTVKIMFWSITQEPLMPFLSSLDNWLLDAYIMFHKGVDNFDRAQNMLVFG